MSRSIASVIAAWSFNAVSVVDPYIFGEVQPTRQRKRNHAPQIKATVADCLAKSSPGAGSKRAKRRQKGKRHATV